LDLKKENIKKATESLLADLAKNDPQRPVRAVAISKLGQLKNPAYASLFNAAVNDSSYTVSGNALDALSNVDSAAALNAAKRLSALPAKGRLNSVITNVIIKSGDESLAETVLNSFDKTPFGQAKFNLVQSIGDFLGKTKNTDLVKRGVDAIVNFRDAIPEAFRGQTLPFINGTVLTDLVKKKTEAGLKDQADYIKSKLPEEDKKGF
jgi:aminopeptidase N